MQLEASPETRKWHHISRSTERQKVSPPGAVPSLDVQCAAQCSQLAAAQRLQLAASAKALPGQRLEQSVARGPSLSFMPCTATRTCHWPRILLTAASGSLRKWASGQPKSYFFIEMKQAA